MDLDEIFEELQTAQGLEQNDVRFVRRIRSRWQDESIIPSRRERTHLLGILTMARDVKMPCKVADRDGRCPWLTKRKRAAVTLRCPFRNPNDQAGCDGYRPDGKPGYVKGNAHGQIEGSRF